MDHATARRRTALFALFFIPGLSLASWVTRTPDVRDLLGATTAEMGLILVGLSAGSMIGILGSGALVSRFGTRPVATVGILTATASAPVVGIGAGLASSVLVAAGLFLFGFGMGGSEVAMNVEGADVEQIIGRAVLPLMHGFFSFGTVLGAVAGMFLTAADFSVTWHLVVIGLITAPVAALAVRQLPSGVGVQPRTATADKSGPSVWRDTRLLLIGVVVLAMALAEGAANDWLPLLMVDGHGFDAALGSGVYVVFAAAMTIGRFGGGWFLDRFSRAAVLGASAVIGGIGVALVVFVDNQIVAAAAVLLWGVGAALGFPVALSAAGDSGDNPTTRVALVASAGYVAFLVGPPALGFLGEHYGLRYAMVAVLALLAVAAVVAPALNRPKTPVPV
ncbi:MFS transporter [Actinoplanes derwentensis]|uniref:Fucose permease n=1 Tax=Actinoplanes derwentensis TaxID=113562 RepID=A0A1H1UQF0_9ACTN|nr:MFS transporter [Actinoplanes derwentensis]GID88130.1 MFS transporter [Actinoplanes derwentensis]SDS74491.1 Fucose permease [Actinoplanes derwentensis]